MRRSNRCHDTEEWGWDSWDRNRCDCCQDWEQCSPERHKKESAQFVGDQPQRVTVPTDTAVNIAPTRVFDGRAITIEGANGVRLERGRYEVDYYLTITNNDNDNDTFVARLRVAGATSDALSYTSSRVRLSSVANDLNIGFLTKPNIVEVNHTSFLQLVVNLDPLTDDANYTITDASIKVVKIG